MVELLLRVSMIGFVIYTAMMGCDKIHKVTHRYSYDNAPLGYCVALLVPSAVVSGVFIGSGFNIDIALETARFSFTILTSLGAWLLIDEYIQTRVTVNNIIFLNLVVLFPLFSAMFFLAVEPYLP